MSQNARDSAMEAVVAILPALQVLTEKASTSSEFSALQMLVDKTERLIEAFNLEHARYLVHCKGTNFVTQAIIDQSTNLILDVDDAICAAEEKIELQDLGGTSEEIERKEEEILEEEAFSESGEESAYRDSSTAVSELPIVENLATLLL